MELPVRYFTLPRPKDAYVSARSLAEQVARRELLRRGYRVTRGAMLDCLFDGTLFDDSDAAAFVRWKLVQQLGVPQLVRLAKYCRAHHGTPDFLAVHAARGVLGVEVKLGHEAIAHHQLETMRQLTRWGVPCEVWRISGKHSKVREKQIDLSAWQASGDVRASTEKKAFERSVTVYGRRRAAKE